MMMSIPLHLRVQQLANGGWFVSLGHRDERRSEGTLPPDRVAALRSALHAALRPEALPLVILPQEDDATVSHLEEQAGRALGATLTEIPGIAATLARHTQLDHGGPHPAPALCVDVDPELRALPWELLVGAAGPLEANGSAVVARLLGGPARTPPPAATSLRVVPWCPNPDDPTCRRMLTHLQREVTALGAYWGSAPPGQARNDEAEVLVVVSHGTTSRPLASVLLGEAEAGAGTVAVVLGPLLRRAALGVLVVCGGGGEAPTDVESLAARMVASGLPACVAPVRQLGVEAALAFSSALLRALTEQATLVESVGAGRRAVRALARGEPDLRWCNLAFFVGDLGTPAGGPVVARQWLPLGCPTPGPDASALFQRAWELANMLGSGYVGVEHLLLSVDAAGGGPAVAQTRLALTARRQGVLDLLEGLTPNAPLAPNAPGTPRLRALVARMPHGFTQDQLWRQVLADPGCVLRVVRGAALPVTMSGIHHPERTLRTGTLEVPGNTHPAVSLEVVGGPEDGRVLSPTSGDVIGRYTERSLETTVPLYRDAPATDLRVSRAHLVWEGDGTVSALRGVERQEGGAWSPVPSGTFLLMASTVLALSPATFLRALGPDA